MSASLGFSISTLSCNDQKSKPKRRKAIYTLEAKHGKGRARSRGSDPWYLHRLGLSRDQATAPPPARDFPGSRPGTQPPEYHAVVFIIRHTSPSPIRIGVRVTCCPCIRPWPTETICLSVRPLNDSARIFLLLKCTVYSNAKPSVNRGCIGVCDAS